MRRAEPIGFDEADVVLDHRDEVLGGDQLEQTGAPSRAAGGRVRRQQLAVGIEQQRDLGVAHRPDGDEVGEDVIEGDDQAGGAEPAAGVAEDRRADRQLLVAVAIVLDERPVEVLPVAGRLVPRRLAHVRGGALERRRGHGELEAALEARPQLVQPGVGGVHVVRARAAAAAAAEVLAHRVDDARHGAADGDDPPGLGLDLRAGDAGRRLEPDRRVARGAVPEQRTRRGPAVLVGMADGRHRHVERVVQLRAG